jgi:2-polyprenyl-6-methoxyphenol hydroxylase-like FAD-dependent oxidoreductase
MTPQPEVSADILVVGVGPTGFLLTNLLSLEGFDFALLVV